MTEDYRQLGALDEVPNETTASGPIQVASEPALMNETNMWEAIKEITTCPTCEGKGMWAPECYACLSGEPDRCDCISQQPETCPQCDGSGREFYGSKLAEAVYCANKTSANP